MGESSVRSHPEDPHTGLLPHREAPEELRLGAETLLFFTVSLILISLRSNDYFTQNCGKNHNFVENLLGKYSKKLLDEAEILQQIL